jgi:hypothetical protein
MPRHPALYLASTMSSIRVLALIAVLCVCPKLFAQATDTCSLHVPDVVSPNMEKIPAATCTCPLTSVDVKLYNRWGKEVWATTDLRDFPQGLLALNDLAAGTYFWSATFTTGGQNSPPSVDQTGHITVVK